MVAVSRQAWRTTFDIAGAIVMMVGTVVLVLLLYRSSSRQQRSAAATLPPPAEPIDLVGAPILGNRAARVALVVFAEFECPACGTFAREILPEFERTYVTTGLVQVAFMNMPDVLAHPFARLSSQAALCADRQGRFWDMHAELFRNQQQLDRSSLGARATRLHLDELSFTECLRETTASQIRSDIGQGVLLGVNATPTLFIGKVQADDRVLVVRRIVGAVPVNVLRPIIDELLSGKTEGGD